MAYFSNSSDGYILRSQCAECPLGEKQCPTLLVHLVYNYAQCRNDKLREAMNALVNEEGECQTRKLLVEKA